MGLLRHLINGDATASAEPTFAIDSTSVPAQVFGLTSYDETTSIAARIDRRRALQVPAVRRARALVPGVLGTLPLELFGPDRLRVPWALFEQPEPDVPRSVTMGNTFADVFFEGHAWWRVIARDWRGWPTSVRRLDPRSVQVRGEQRVFVKRDGVQQGTAWEWVPDTDLIRFYGPDEEGDGLLTSGARAIRTCLLLDAAAANMADGVPPIEFFTPADPNVDPGTTEEITAALEEWRRLRRERTTGYVPAAFKYNAGGVDPEKLQLAEARQHAVLEIARLAGVDAEDLGVSTTSRTYQNGFERRKALIDFTLAGYMVAFAERLSMRDITPRGFTAGFNPDGLLRADASDRWSAYKEGLAVGAITPERIAELEGVPVDQVRKIAAAPTPPPALPAAPDTEETE